MNSDMDNSIVALDRFIQSTRDSGYKSTASAISELIDNALQAGAKNVSILIEKDVTEKSSLRVAVSDDGKGMDEKTLIQSMRFGGSSRFNNREGLGRFGMGLPNASLSQARRVEVYSWKNGTDPLFTYLDVDEIATGSMVQVIDPYFTEIPGWLGVKQPSSGTIVAWRLCDRLDHKRISTLERKLSESLGRIFRHFLWSNVRIDINGSSVTAIDPLFINKTSKYHGANQFQEIWETEIYADPDNPDSPVGKIEVIFTELPIQDWHNLSNDQKRAMGITNNAGVSIVRGGREIDYGWFFMGKRRENYDDWWRSEIRFDPSLDEAFGITHTKQQIRPKEHLQEMLRSYMETVSKALNGRVRQANVDIKAGGATLSAELVAEDRDRRLRSLPELDRENSLIKNMEIENLSKRHAGLNQALIEPKSNGLRYKIIEDELSDSCFFKPLSTDGVLVGVLNPRHKFYKRIYKPLLDNKDTVISDALQLMMIAAARAEASFVDQKDKEVIDHFRHEWSHAMDVLLAAR